MRIRQMRLRQRVSVDAFLYALSVYGVPLLIGLVSLIALTSWRSEYAEGSAQALEFRVAPMEGVEDPEEALARLAALPPVRHRDTGLSEVPFWFAFRVQATAADQPLVIELPSRHARQTECWRDTDFESLGAATRQGASGRLVGMKAGFGLELGAPPLPLSVVCRAEFTGPARISVLQWSQQHALESIEKFHRNSGLIDGGLIVLALFVLITAVINHEWMYVLFAAWLVANLRLGAMSAGWDMQWLERSVPGEYLVPMRQFTIAAYYFLTYTLFSRLFGDELRRVGYPALLRLARATCLLILAYAMLLPYRYFLPAMWATAAIGVAALIFLLGRILLKTRSRVAIWYGISLAIAVFANLYEVVSAALGLKGLIGAVNSVTAALASSLMAAIALAEQMRLERQERLKAQAELRAAYEAIPIGLFTLNAQGVFTQTNPALDAMLGLRGRRAHHWSDHFEQGAWERLQDIVSSGPGLEVEFQSAARPGREPKWFLVKATYAKEKIEGSLQDVTERVKATQRLGFLADHDPLTGILNRRGIEKILDDAVRRHASGTSLALAYLDLDRFKLINDLFGHMAGDEVLKQVCSRVKELLVDGQEIGRVGGDEFVIVFQGASIQSAAWTCRGIIERIGNVPYQIGERAFQVKGSIGLVEVDGAAETADVISVADRACREAKHGHDGNLVVYEKDAPVFGERREELRLIGRLGANVAPDGLCLVMQPILSLKAPYESLNFEILLRMREGDGRILPAGKIITAAESNGRISVIDRWVLSHALEWLSAHQAHLGRTKFASLNLSGGSLNDERFVQDAFAILGQYRHIADRVCIEITESVALHDLDNTRRFIEGVRSYGAKIALDDFGAGYTSFSYLKELPADAVKIDGAFVKGINSHPANLAIIEAIAELARNLGMRSVAEWAEDRAVLEALTGIGVDYVQGFAIAQPQEPSRILLAESSASFIEDDAVALFVRDALAKGSGMELWRALDPRRTRIH